jgi:hypothetical protein
MRKTTELRTRPTAKWDRKTRENDTHPGQNFKREANFRKAEFQGVSPETRQSDRIL